MEKHNKTSDENAPPFALHTPLAKRLWELRQEVLASGTPLLNLDEIRQEFQGFCRKVAFSRVLASVSR